VSFAGTVPWESFLIWHHSVCCCSVLQYVAMFGIVLQRIACGVNYDTWIYTGIIRYVVAVCCSVVQCGAACCSVVQCVAVLV